MRPRFVGDAAFVHRWQIWAMASLTFETESSTGGSSLDRLPDEALVSEPRDFLEPREPIEQRSSRDDGPFFFGCGAFFGCSGWSLS